MEEILQSLVQPLKEVAQTFSYMLLFGFVFICLEWIIPSSKRLFKLLFMLIICIYCLEPAIRALEMIQVMTNELVNLFLGIYPILTLGIAASGGAFLITAWNPAVMLFASFTTILAGKILIPAIMAAFLFDLISRIHPPTSFSKMSDLIRLTLIGSTSIILLLYSIFMSVNGMITWSVSGTVNETVKRLIQNNIPFVGSLLTESISTLKNFSSSASVITGNAVIVSVLMLVSIPTIQTILIAFLYRLLGAILEPFVDGNISGLIDDIGKTLFVLSIISVLIAFTFFFTIVLTMLFAKLLISGKG